MRFPIALGFLGITACYGGFDSSLGLRSRQGATLSVTIQDAATVDVWATLHPGTTSGGDQRSVQGPMTVRGAAVPFPGTLPQVPTTVTARIDLGAIRGVQPLTVVPPAIAGLTPDPAQLSFSTFRLRDGDTVTTTPGGAVRLSTQVAMGTGVVLERSWELTVVGATAITVRGTGLPPDVLTLPADLLPAQRPSAARGWSLVMNFREVQGRYAQTLPLTSEYLVSGSLSQRVIVEVRPAAP